MILSVSRRTDIPCNYAEWFMNRLKDGYLEVRNPMYPEKVSKIAITDDVIDCIVFWSKNPKPMIPYLDKLKNYSYYFQFPITGYGQDVEPGLPEKKELLKTFIELSQRIGKERVIWRYDPIFFTSDYSMEAHIQTFTHFCAVLRGHTNRCVISFLDLYGHITAKMNDLGVKVPNEEEMRKIAREFSKIAKENGIEIETCAEKIDLSEEGVKHGHCIDKEFIENLVGYRMTGGKDKGQRTECGCMESIDIGKYSTCMNGCRYCYADNGMESIPDNRLKYDKDSPFLCDRPEKGDIVTERKMKSLRRKRG